MSRCKGFEKQSDKAAKSGFSCDFATRRVTAAIAIFKSCKSVKECLASLLTGRWRRPAHQRRSQKRGQAAVNRLWFGMLHFTFLDGAIGYDCVRCGGRCCHGRGFALGGGELIPVLALAPRLAPFMQLQRDAVLAFDLSDGCWMLAADGRCSIEVIHGRAAKPSTCKLFPTNHLLRAGAVTVVDLQFQQCPLVDAAELGPTRPGTTVIRHQDVVRDIEEAGDGAIVAEAHLPAALPNDWLRRETEVRDATRSLLDAADPLTVLAGAAGAAAQPLDELRSRWHRWLELDEAEAAAAARALARPFALCLPSLRWAALTLPGARPWPKLAATLDAHLLALAFYAGLSVRAGLPPSLRGLAELWRATPLLRDLLVRWSSPVTLADAPAPASAPAELAAAWSQLRTRAAAQPIGDALESVALPPALRPLLLRLAADRLR
jgi:hypothetical protein